MIHIQKLKSNATVPTRGSTAAAGLDFYATDHVTIMPGDRQLISTGIAVAMTKGTYLRLAPRSGLAVKHGIDVLAGVVDSDYRGEVKILLVNLGKWPFSILPGDKIAQGIPEVIAEESIKVVNKLEDTKRGEQGFGSTG